MIERQNTTEFYYLASVVIKRSLETVQKQTMGIIRQLALLAAISIISVVSKIQSFRKSEKKFEVNVKAARVVSFLLIDWKMN